MNAGKKNLTKNVHITKLNQYIHYLKQEPLNFLNATNLFKTETGITKTIHTHETVAAAANKSESAIRSQ